ncbi:hypothetical protein HDU82_000482 [Entophlyctis luteolus]|nr:hypothetical protein HDU82_000482 [Entophlyctis luteolus]
MIYILDGNKEKSIPGDSVPASASDQIFDVGNDTCGTDVIDSLAALYAYKRQSEAPSSFWTNLFKPVLSLLFVLRLLLSMIWRNIPRPNLNFISSYLRRRATRAHFEKLLESATCYAQYEAASRELDILDGYDVWKRTQESSDYDYHLLHDRLRQLRWLGAGCSGSGGMGGPEIVTMGKKGDPHALSYMLRSTLCRNLGDMGNTKLYGYARIGTKDLIHEYIDEVIKQLNYLADTDFGDVFDNEDKLVCGAQLTTSLMRKQEFLQKHSTKLRDNSAASQWWCNVWFDFFSFRCSLQRPYTGMIHVGVLKALYEANSLPRIISGSSAGSIVAALLCSQHEDSIDVTLDPTLTNTDFYEDRNEVGNIFPKLYRFMNHGCVFDVEEFIKATKANIGGDLTFQEAYNKSRRVLNIAVSSSTTFEMPRLLNYLTAPNVIIRLLREFIKISDLGIFKQAIHRLRSILVQKYTGDVTIVPEILPQDYRHIIQNPGSELTEYLTLKGERATWSSERKTLDLVPV